MEKQAIKENDIKFSSNTDFVKRELDYICKNKC
jgi:hypothetical protein